MQTTRSSKETESFDYQGWESEVSPPPPVDESIVRFQQKDTQSLISTHKCIDHGVKWEEVPVTLPIPNVGMRVSKKESKFGVSSKQKAVGPVKNPPKTNSSIYINTTVALGKVFSFMFEVVGVIVKSFLIILLHILGVKKTRRKRAVRRTSTRVKTKKRKRTQRGSIANGKTKIASPPHQKARDWNEISAEFIPSSDLYCYWCTKKLGMKSWQSSGHYYCETCYNIKK